jgi:hypothetical protein
MGRTVVYQNYTITSSPLHDTQNDQWKLHISISWGIDGKTVSRTFWMPILYSTETQADIHGVAYGQRIIDGKVAGLELK